MNRTEWLNRWSLLHSRLQSATSAANALHIFFDDVAADENEGATEVAAAALAAADKLVENITDEMANNAADYPEYAVLVTPSK